MDTAAISLTALALLAFAGNSILCRLALGDQAIDPASYTAVRLGSGALVLWLIASRSSGRAAPGAVAGTFRAAALLFLYAVAFSFAYMDLSAGAGALILFAAVQLTMIAAGLHSGERPAIGEWLGWALAVAGLVYLLLPGWAAPPLIGSLLMGLAGVAWGLYSLMGRGAHDPIATTAGNFLRTVPLILLLVLAQAAALHPSPMGLLWAGLSGAVTSGLGYVVWYAALSRLTATRAATVQLAVPVIAAVGGIIFLAEPVSLRLFFSASAILGGIGLALSARAFSMSLMSGGKAGRTSIAKEQSNGTQ
jgi:drug/metabolite transporter (DMT)-like permease